MSDSVNAPIRPTGGTGVTAVTAESHLTPLKNFFFSRGGVEKKKNWEGVKWDSAVTAVTPVTVDGRMGAFTLSDHSFTGAFTKDRVGRLFLRVVLRAYGTDGGRASSTSDRRSTQCGCRRGGEKRWKTTRRASCSCHTLHNTSAPGRQMPLEAFARAGHLCNAASQPL